MGDSTRTLEQLTNQDVTSDQAAMGDLTGTKVDLTNQDVTSDQATTSDLTDNKRDAASQNESSKMMDALLDTFLYLLLVQRGHIEAAGEMKGNPKCVLLDIQQMMPLLVSLRAPSLNLFRPNICGVVKTSTCNIESDPLLRDGDAISPGIVQKKQNKKLAIRKKSVAVKACGGSMPSAKHPMADATSSGLPGSENPKFVRKQIIQSELKEGFFIPSDSDMFSHLGKLPDEVGMKSGLRFTFSGSGNKKYKGVVVKINRNNCKILAVRGEWGKFAREEGLKGGDYVRVVLRDGGYAMMKDGCEEEVPHVNRTEDDLKLQLPTEDDLKLQLPTEDDLDLKLQLPTEDDPN